IEKDVAYDGKFTLDPDKITRVFYNIAGNAADAMPKGGNFKIRTYKSDVKDRVLGLNLGADDYLPKPFAFSELLARIRSLMRRAGGEKSNELTLEDLTVNIATRKVTRAGKKIMRQVVGEV
ncbi:MAG: hypothetical protein ABIK27_09435, partial [Bacteroidota bacterium]